MLLAQASDAGLPAPDRTVFLQMSPATAASRSGYGEERYENIRFQEQVAQQYNALAQQDPACWSILDADQDEGILSHEVTACQPALDRFMDVLLNLP